MPRNLSVRCLWLAGISLAFMLGWQEFIIHFRYGGVQNALFYTGALRPIPPQLRAGTYTFPSSSGYDGQFYRYVAHDPFFRRGFNRYVDDPRNRYGRILVPILAWAVSAGQDRLIDRAYQLVAVAFCALGVYWTCGWLALRGWRPVWGVPAFLLLPATLASLDRLLVDGPLCAMFAGQIYYARLGRWRGTYVIAAAAPLLRETGVLILAGVLTAAAIEKQWRRFAVFATAAIPVSLWTLWVAAHTPPTGATHNFEKPVVGLILRLFTVTRDYPGLDKSLYPVMQTIDFLAIVGYLGSLAIAATWLWTRREKWEAQIIVTVAVFLLMALLLGHAGYLLTPYAYGRPLSPLFLWVALEALSSRNWAAIVPPGLVSLGVAIYPAYAAVRALETLVKR